MNSSARLGQVETLVAIDAQHAKASVVGLWLGESRTQGGLGNLREFHADGTVELGSSRTGGVRPYAPAGENDKRVTVPSWLIAS